LGGKNSTEKSFFPPAKILPIEIPLLINASTYHDMLMRSRKMAFAKTECEN